VGKIGVLIFQYLKFFMQPQFIHLRLHTEFSLVDGIVRIKPLIKRLTELNMPAVAVTEQSNLFSLVKFYSATIAAGIKAIFGADVYLYNSDEPTKPFLLTLLVNTQQGYVTLTELISKAYQEGQHLGVPMLKESWLIENHGGLIALSGAMEGDIGQALLSENTQLAQQLAQKWAALFKNSFYLELQRIGKVDEARYLEAAVLLAITLDLPVVATNNVRFLHKDDFAAHEVRVCINQKEVIDNDRRPRNYTEQQYLRSTEEMLELFADIPEALANTVEIAKRCNVGLTLGKNYLPDFPVPLGKTLDEVFRQASKEGLNQRLQEYAPIGSGTFEENRKTYDARLQLELDVICQMGFPGYFMIVADFIQWAKKALIPVGPGRGSGAGSLVAYVLRITDLDPIEFDLLFERFLNPERVSMPDFDIDFCMERRDEVIDYVARHYGRDKVSQIITYGSMAAKAVIRDVGRVSGHPYGFVDRLSKLVPFEIGMTLEKALLAVPELKDLYDTDEEVKALLDRGLSLEGISRNAGKHAGGVIISPTKLTDFTPLYCDEEGNNLVTQFDKDDVEAVGLVKFDFLGLRTLTIIDWALQTINAKKKKQGEALVDINKIPRDDIATYKNIFQTAQTTAVFQLESRGMKELIGKLKPDCFDDIIALVALYRPGPLESGMVDDYINVKHGAKAEYAHPILEPILQPTNGVILYQEQVMQIAREMAGYTLGGADMLRRAMGKKKPEEMAQQREIFTTGSIKNNIDESLATYVFDLISKFAGYGFNKCLTKDTLIANSETGALKKIVDWYKQPDLNEVISLQKNYSLGKGQVIDIIKNGVKPIFKLTTSLGKTITVTNNHPFFTVKGWVNLESLNVGDRIASPAYLPINGKKTWSNYQLIILGWILSEGNTCHPSGFYFYNNDINCVEDFIHAASQFKNTVPRSYQRKDRNNIYEVYVGTGHNGRIKKGDQRNKIEHSGARLWLESLKLTGIKAPKKSFPNKVFELSNDCIAILIGRLWSGDGFIAIPNNTTPYFASSSYQLVIQLQHLLLRFKIVSRLTQKEFHYKEGRIGYTLHILGRRSIENFIGSFSIHIIGKNTQLTYLQSYLSSVAKNSESIDTVPAEVQEIVYEEKNRSPYTWLEIEQRTGVCVKAFYGKLKKHKKGFRRLTILKLAEFFNSEKLHQIIHPDLFWERVINIEAVGEDMTYDLEIKTSHNFVANDIIVHNSHSAAYALVAYQTAWLKAHYPAAFMAAVLSADMDNTDKVVMLIEECRQMKLDLAPPNVNVSNYHFTTDDPQKIVYGIGAIKGVGQSAIEDLIDERKQKGLFSGLYDLCKRVELRKVNRRVLEALIRAGAFDIFDNNRAGHFAELPIALRIANQHGKMAVTGQNDMFGLMVQTENENEGDESYSTDVEPWAERDRLEGEKQSLGLYLTGHPINQYQQELKQFTHGTINKLLGDVERSRGKVEARVAGLVLEIRTRQTKKGTTMGFAVLDDRTGRLEVAAFSNTYEQYRDVFVKDALLVVEGGVAMDDFSGMLRLTAEKMYSIEQARAIFARCLTFEWDNRDASIETVEFISLLREIITPFKGGDCPLVIHYFSKEAATKVQLGENWRVQATDELILHLQRCPHIKAVAMKYNK